MAATKEIQIDTWKISGHFSSGDGTVYVTDEKHWDPLNKAFKKYKHTIEYKHGYKLSDYSITVYGPSTGVRKTFRYKALNERVKEVEVFFKADDKPINSNPLVVGFISPNWTGRGGSRATKGCKIISGRTGSKCYYTWNYLTSTKKEFTGDIDEAGAIMDKDLITGLLEELETSKGRQKKLVIRLDERTNGGGGELQYPDSPYFKGQKRITVRKESEFEGFVGYEHRFDDTVTECYVSYLNDSRHIKVDPNLGSGYANIASVTVYYKTTTSGSGRDTAGSNKPVLITFYLTSGTTHVYSYYDFIKDIKTKPTETKTITDKDAIDNPALQRKLKEECKKLEPLIAFKSSGRDNENITTKPEDIRARGKGEETFKKVTLKPNTKDESGGSSIGPWNVYSNKLFTYEQYATIDNSTLRGFSGIKYESITVFYTSDNKAVLLEFDKSGTSTSRGGSKTYYIRKNKEGTQWVKANAGEIVTSGGDVTIEKLAQIRETAFGGSTSVGSPRCSPGSRGTEKEIHIEMETNKPKGYYKIGDGKVTVEVTVEDHWDKLSKVFKRYTHTIEYPTEDCYVPSDYKITVYGQVGSGFTYEKPSKRVIQVEVYFRTADNVKSKNPLVVGFVYHNTVSDSSKCYYTWADLKNSQYDCTITGIESISENDLVTVLLEIGSIVRYRLNKHVIRLDEKPAGEGGGGRFEYPESKYFTGSNRKITVTKVDDTGVPEYDKYVHTFNTGSGGDAVGTSVGTVEECYVTYERNSRYFMTDTKAERGLGLVHRIVESSLKGDKIKSVTAYYKIGTHGTTGITDINAANSKKLVLIMFTLTSGSTYVYRYSDFINDLETWSSDSKIIEKLKDIGTGDGGGTELQSILQEESEKLKESITFEKGDSRNDLTSDGRGNGGQGDRGGGTLLVKPSSLTSNRFPGAESRARTTTSSTDSSDSHPEKAGPADSIVISSGSVSTPVGPTGARGDENRTGSSRVNGGTKAVLGRGLGLGIGLGLELGFRVASRVGSRAVLWLGRGLGLGLGLGLGRWRGLGLVSTVGSLFKGPVGPAGVDGEEGRTGPSLNKGVNGGQHPQESQVQEQHVEQQQQESQVQEQHVEQQQQESQVHEARVNSTGSMTTSRPEGNQAGTVGGGRSGVSSNRIAASSTTPGGDLGGNAGRTSGSEGSLSRPNGPGGNGPAGSPAEGGGDTAIYAGVGGGVGATGILGGGAGYAIYRYIRK